MIRHIVMWKLKDFAEGASKEENFRIMKAGLEALPALMPQIVKIEVGRDISNSPASFDAVLYSEFENQKDLDFYMNHPMHKKISDFIGKIRTERAVVDYVWEK